MSKDEVRDALMKAIGYFYERLDKKAEPLVTDGEFVYKARALSEDNGAEIVYQKNRETGKEIVYAEGRDMSLDHLPLDAITSVEFDAKKMRVGFNIKTGCGSLHALLYMVDPDPAMSDYLARRRRKI